jgi:hypothetical protein
MDTPDDHLGWKMTRPIFKERFSAQHSGGCLYGRLQNSSEKAHYSGADFTKTFFSKVQPEK